MNDERDPNKDFINTITYLENGLDILSDMENSLDAGGPRLNGINGTNVGTFKRLLGPGRNIKRSGTDTIGLLQKFLR